MAKIVATYDSETKEIGVTIDGVDQGDVTSFSCYKDKCGDECYGGCSINMASVKENGVTYHHSAYAENMTQKEKLEAYFRHCLSRK